MRLIHLARTLLLGVIASAAAARTSTGSTPRSETSTLESAKDIFDSIAVSIRDQANDHPNGDANPSKPRNIIAEGLTNFMNWAGNNVPDERVVDMEYPYRGIAAAMSEVLSDWKTVIVPNLPKIDLPTIKGQKEPRYALKKNLRPSQIIQTILKQHRENRQLVPKAIRFGEQVRYRDTRGQRRRAALLNQSVVKALESKSEVRMALQNDDGHGSRLAELRDPADVELALLVRVFFATEVYVIVVNEIRDALASEQHVSRQKIKELKDRILKKYNLDPKGTLSDLIDYGGDSKAQRNLQGQGPLGTSDFRSNRPHNFDDHAADDSSNDSPVKYTQHQDSPAQDASAEELGTGEAIRRSMQEQFPEYPDLFKVTGEEAFIQKSAQILSEHEIKTGKPPADPNRFDIGYSVNGMDALRTKETDVKYRASKQGGRPRR